MTRFEIPIDLKRAICNNQLIVFVGAGLSYDLVNMKGEQLKGWSNLVEQILKGLNTKGYDVNDLVPLVKRYDPILVLKLIESDNTLPKKEIYNFIKDYLELDDGKNNYLLHKKLNQLSSKLITTNYDTAFERAVPELRRYKAYKGKNYELTTHKDQNSTLLFKLHGCYEDADSMVLFPSNYNDLYKNPDRDAEHSLLVLRNIVYNKTILFVGTGMGDFQINNIFKEINKIQGEYSQKHFIITNKTLDSALNFLVPLNVQNYTEIEEFIDLLNSIKEECGSNESNEILELRRQLEEANKKIEEIATGVIPNKERLLEREALKYFSKGLELQLSNEPVEAVEKYKTALELKPDFHEAFYNWGTYLANLARTKEGKASEDLYREAFDKYRSAVKWNPNFHEAFYNWGNSLVNLARIKEGKEAESLYREAFDKYKNAIKIRPDKNEAYNNWGTSLANLARTIGVKESEKLFRKAYKKLNKAIELGSSPYNLACLYAVQGNRIEALKFLKMSLVNDRISIDYVLNDEDWKDYLKDDEFVSLTEEYKN